MGIKIKIMNAPEMTFLDRLYLPQIIQGLWITFKHLIGFKQITIQYPEEIKELPPRYRGLHILPGDDEGEIRCVACKLCEVACPTQAISIVAEAADNYGVERRPKIYNIDFMRCVFCGFCVEACPCDALRMGMKYELSSYNRAGLIHTKEVFFDPNVKSYAPRDNANFLYEMGKGNILDNLEEADKVKELTGRYIADKDRF
jgi:NADH-quinone oxidoreductase subunit I